MTWGKTPMWDELVKSIRANLHERATSPLLGTYSVAWALWNFRLLLVIFSELPVDAKLNYIHNNFFADWQSYTHVFFFPLIGAGLFIFAYPYPAKVVYKYWREKQNEIKKIRQQIDDETPLTKEEANQIRREALEAELKYENDIRALAQENRGLKEIIKSLEAPPGFLSKRKRTKATETAAEAVKPSADIADEQIVLLKIIGDSPEKAFRERLIRASNASRVKAEYDIDDLLERGYINQGSYDSNKGGYKYKLSQKGRAELIKKGLT